MPPECLFEGAGKGRAARDPVAYNLTLVGWGVGDRNTQAPDGTWFGLFD